MTIDVAINDTTRYNAMWVAAETYSVLGKDICIFVKRESGI